MRARSATVLSALLILLSSVRLPAAEEAGERTAATAAPVPGEAELLARMAREGTNVATLFLVADLCHDAGVDGDKKAVPRAEAYLRRLLELEPANAAGMALLGSVYTLKGRDAFWPTTQIRLVREGNEYLDRGVQLAPESIQVRLIRALNNAHMPDFLGRREVVRADLAWLWEKQEKDPAPFSAKQRQEVAWHWGRNLGRMGRAEEGRRVWEQGRAIDPDSPMGRKLGEELAKER